MKFIKKILAIFILVSIYTYAQRINLNFSNLTINDFIKITSKITGINILIDKKIKGKLNFTVYQAIEKKELIPLTKTILESKGMTLENIKGGYKVVKINQKEPKIKTVLFQLADKKEEISSLLEKCQKYEYISNKKGDFYLVVTADKDILISIKEIIEKRL